MFKSQTLRSSEVSRIFLTSETQRRRSLEAVGTARQVTARRAAALKVLLAYIKFEFGHKHERILGRVLPKLGTSESTWLGIHAAPR